MEKKKLNNKPSRTLLISNNGWNHLEIAKLREFFCPEEQIIYDPMYGNKLLIPGLFSLELVTGSLDEDKEFELRHVLT